jgi:hypothetical protein
VVSVPSFPPAAPPLNLRGHQLHPYLSVYIEKVAGIHSPPLLKITTKKKFHLPFFKKSIKDYNLALIVSKFMIENRLAKFHAIDKTNIGEINE